MLQANAVNQDRMVKTFMDLVLIDSPSGQEEAIGRELSKRLRDLGCEVHQDKAGNLVAELPGEGKEAILLSTHMNTVGTDTGIKPILRDGVVYSDGTTILGADDKSGIAIVLEILQQLREHPEWRHPPLEIVMTVSEEQGLRGSRQMDLSRLRATWGVVLDTTGPIGTFTYAAPFSRYFTFTINGRAAHAGVEPEKGVSAIRVAAEAIAEMPLGRLDEETVANVGTVEGGVARNIVADRAVLKAMTRSHDDDKLEAQTATMVKSLEAAAARNGATLEVEVEDVYKGYTISPDQRPYREVARAAERLGLPGKPKKSGGGTDANLFNHAGVQCVPVSTGMAAEHTKDEHIAIADMVDAARLVLALVVRDESAGPEPAPVAGSKGGS